MRKAYYGSQTGVKLPYPRDMFHGPTYYTGCEICFSAIIVLDEPKVK